MIEITIETLKRFGGLFALLLFTAALMMDLEMLDEHYMPTAEGVLLTFQDFPLLEWALTNSAREIQVVGWAFVLGCLVAFVYFFVWFIAQFLQRYTFKWNTIPRCMPKHDSPSCI
jgi:hypothetical protein